jgi:hypothetical protein
MFDGLYDALFGTGPSRVTITEAQFVYPMDNFYKRTDFLRAFAARAPVVLPKTAPRFRIGLVSSNKGPPISWSFDLEVSIYQRKNEFSPSGTWHLEEQKTTPKLTITFQKNRAGTYQLTKWTVDKGTALIGGILPLGHQNLLKLCTGWFVQVGGTEGVGFSEPDPPRILRLKLDSEFYKLFTDLVDSNLRPNLWRSIVNRSESITDDEASLLKFTQEATKQFQKERAIWERRKTFNLDKELDLPYKRRDGTWYFRDSHYSYTETYKITYEVKDQQGRLLNKYIFTPKSLGIGAAHLPPLLLLVTCPS